MEQMVERPGSRKQTKRASSPTGLIMRQKEPNNLEAPFDQLDSFITPTELFYIRSHFPAPQIDSTSFLLEVSGAVESPLSISYEQLRAMPAETRVATLECAGNSRVFLVPQVRGAQWELGAVGNAEWTGVPLSTVLAHAGLKDDACEIVLEGADRGHPPEEPVPPCAISYVRSIPRAKALKPEVLLAYQMNGHDLPVDHGFPLRAVVPGHYGMASVKWLTRIHAVREPFLGYWQTTDYGFWDERDGAPVRRPLGEMKIKSQISRPRTYETIAPNRSYIVSGAAWAGEIPVTGIEVSTDGGRTWSEGNFLDPIHPFAWRRWVFDWRTPAAPGRYLLMSRAWDASGAPQPDKHDENYGSYVINHPIPIEVFVDAPEPRRKQCGVPEPKGAEPVDYAAQRVLSRPAPV